MTHAVEASVVTQAWSAPLRGGGGRSIRLGTGAHLNCKGMRGRSRLRSVVEASQFRQIGCSSHPPLSNCKGLFEWAAAATDMLMRSTRSGKACALEGYAINVMDKPRMGMRSDREKQVAIAGPCRVVPGLPSFQAAKEKGPEL